MVVVVTKVVVAGVLVDGVVIVIVVVDVVGVVVVIVVVAGAVLEHVRHDAGSQHLSVPLPTHRPRERLLGFLHVCVVADVVVVVMVVVGGWGDSSAESWSIAASAE